MGKTSISFVVRFYYGGFHVYYASPEFLGYGNIQEMELEGDWNYKYNEARRSE